MSNSKQGKYATQNDLLLENLLKFYDENNNLERILPIIMNLKHHYV